MRILLVDDDRAFRAALAANLAELPHEVRECGDADEALALAPGFDLLVTDVRLPGMSGVELLAAARRTRPALEVVMMTGHATIDLAVRATREGARAFLEKPFAFEDLLVHVREVEKVVRLREAAGRAGRGALVGASAAMRAVYDAVDAAAGSEANVLVTGPTGSGKEAAAEAVHHGSGRARGPFVAVNVGALPRDLVESELFGALPGAYTGIRDRRMGRFELAAGGTLFLDEINSLPLDIQPKLLRAIEAREVWPLGAQRPVPCDARIVAASNQPLENLVREGMFREDLYYRLHVLEIRLPALADHPADIPAIADRLLEGMAAGRPVSLSADALAALMVRDWPGNVRELRNALERAVARKSASTDRARTRSRDAADVALLLTAADLGTPSASALDVPYRVGRLRAAEEWSRNAVRSALFETRGNISEAARRLQMSRTSLMALLKKWRLPAS